jgi:hypothetical protein
MEFPDLGTTIFRTDLSAADMILQNDVNKKIGLVDTNNTAAITIMLFFRKCVTGKK